MVKRILILAAAAALLAAVLGTSFGPGKSPPLSLSLRSFVRVDPPKPLADGSEKPLSGRIVRPTVVVFWATWCEPCLREIPTLGRFRTMADAAGIDVLTVSLDRSGIDIPRRFLIEQGLGDLPLVLDAGGVVSMALGIRGVPTTLIVNAKGEEVARTEGEADWGDRAALDIVLGLVATGG